MMLVECRFRAFQFDQLVPGPQKYVESHIYIYIYTFFFFNGLWDMILPTLGGGGGYS